MRKKDIKLLLEEVRSYMAGLTSLAQYAIGQDCPEMAKQLAKLDRAIAGLK